MHFLLFTGLRLTHLSVPSVVLAGESTWLNCSYDQGEDDLYSLKWYKDNVEILGYMPMEPEPLRVKIFNLSGVYIDVSLFKSHFMNDFLKVNQPMMSVHCRMYPSYPRFEKKKTILHVIQLGSMISIGTHQRQMVSELTRRYAV